MKRALFLLTVFVVLPVLAMFCVYQVALMTYASETVAQDENTPSLQADHDFYMMSQTEHLAKAKGLCQQGASRDQLFQARRHLVTIPIGAPEYGEAMSLLAQIENSMKPERGQGSEIRGQGRKSTAGGR